MQLLVLTSVIDGVATTAATFEVSVDDGGFLPADTSVPGIAQFRFDDSTSFLDVRVTPTSAAFWPLTGRFKLAEFGVMFAINAPDNFAPPSGVDVAGFSAFSLVAHLSRLRDATTECLASLGAVPPERADAVPAAWPPPVWGAPEVDDVEYFDQQPLFDGQISAGADLVEPAGENVVFERRGARTPRLIAVSWPRSLAPFSAAPPTPFLVYFHATMSQNVDDGYYHGPYPFDFDYVFYGLWNYLNYRENPLTTWPFSLGLPYQVAESEARLVCVLPCSSAVDEIGTFSSAADMATTLTDLQATMFRRAGVYDPPPGIGRVGLAAFSGSNAYISTFLNNAANRADPFYLANLREIFSFEVIDSDVGALVSAVTSWRGLMVGNDIRAHLYRQGESPVLNAFVAPAEHPATRPFIASTGDGRTLGLIPAATWRAAASSRGFPGFGFQFTEIHHLFPSTLLTDALRRSGF
jgi:hypothetical protein